MNHKKDKADPSKIKLWPIIMLPVFLLLGVYFIVTASQSPAPVGPANPLNPDWFTPKTARGEILKYKSLVGNCFICHSTLVPDPKVVQPQFTHKKIKLNHGINTRCYNCHLISDRNKYVADDGSGIMPANVVKVCARCHGLIYSDWLGGTHGVRRGKWSPKTEFERKTFICTECHDPHTPRFQFKEFAPPPKWPDKFIRRSAANIN